jgi:hypothetical protein
MPHPAMRAQEAKVGPAVSRGGRTASLARTRRRGRASVAPPPRFRPVRR